MVLVPLSLARSRSKKRYLILSISALILWLYATSGSSGVISTVDYLTRPALHSQMLDHFNKPLCPRFNKYDRQKLLLLEPNECTPIQSNHPDFSADLCFSPFTCNEGLVRVRRRDRALCRAANLQYPISENATHDAFHRQFSGPDSFHVVFSGAEKLSPPDWYHAGQCLYVFPFHISNPGKLTLDITHLYDNFGAVVEQSDEWPVLKREKVVSNLPLEVCRGCPSRVAAPRFQQDQQESSADGEDAVPLSGAIAKNMYQAYAVSKGNTDSDQPEKQLPQCSKDLAIQGVWLPAHPLDKQNWRHANYTWTPLGCTLGKPLDPTCLERKKKTSKILFQGDTHLRLAMEHLLQRLQGSTTHYNSTTTAAERMTETFGSTTLTYTHDPMFTQTGEKTDMLVGNMGHAATGTKFLDQLWTTSKYHDRLRDLVDRIHQRARDLQDLEDEDEDSTGRFLDGEYGNEADDDSGHDEDEDEEEDEDELEFEHELLRQEKQKAPTVADSIEVYWADETEEENVSSRFSDEQLRQLEEEEEEERLRREALQAELDMIEDRYRVADRYRAEEEGYGMRDRYRNPDSTAERARLRYPNNRVLRQSKYHKASEQSANPNSEDRVPRPRPLYRYASQRKATPGENDNLAKANKGKSASVPSSRRTGDKGKSTIDRKVERTMRVAGRPPGSDGRPSDRPVESETRRPSREGARESFAYSSRKAAQPINNNRGEPKTKGNKEEQEKSPVQSKSNISNEKSSSGSSTEYRMLHRRALASSSPSPDVHDHKQQDLPLKMAWAGMVAYPETQAVSDPMHSHDWRSIYRLRYWNQISEEVMLLHNVRFMDFFSMTLSMLDTSPDRGHYLGTDAAEAMLEELSYKLELCADEDEDDPSENAREQ